MIFIALIKLGWWNAILASVTIHSFKMYSNTLLVLIFSQVAYNNIWYLSSSLVCRANKQKNVRATLWVDNTFYLLVTRLIRILMLEHIIRWFGNFLVRSQGRETRLLYLNFITGIRWKLYTLLFLFSKLHTP